MKDVLCTSCNKKVANVQGSTIFKCPSCGKIEIIRCFECRKLGTQYTCLKCGFKGPN